MSQPRGSGDMPLFFLCDQQLAPVDEGCLAAVERGAENSGISCGRKPLSWGRDAEFLPARKPDANGPVTDLLTLSPDRVQAWP